jgi:hypothetical protein
MKLSTSRLRVSALALTCLVFAVTACGGSDDAAPARTPFATTQASTSSATPVATVARTPTPERPPPTPTNQQILAFAKLYVRTEWNYLASSALPKDLYDMFTPECQKMVTVESLAKTPAAAQAVYTGLKGAYMQDIAFLDTLGVKFDTGNTLQIVAPKFSRSTVTINGKQINMLEWVRSISEVPPQDQVRTFHIVQAGSTLKMASCETLKQWDKG